MAKDGKWFVEVYGMPLRLGKYSPGATKANRESGFSGDPYNNGVIVALTHFQVMFSQEKPIRQISPSPKGSANQNLPLRGHSLGLTL
jgi:hypothetical protein